MPASEPVSMISQLKYGSPKLDLANPAQPSQIKFYPHPIKQQTKWNSPSYGCNSEMYIIIKYIFMSVSCQRLPKKLDCMLKWHSNVSTEITHGTNCVNRIG